MFGFNSPQNTYAIAFADDLLVYVAGDELSETKILLEGIFDKIQYWVTLRVGCKKYDYNEEVTV